jgi:hypothetical protein
MLIRSLAFVLPKTLNYLSFIYFGFERTWWRLFWAYLMKVILSVPDEGYSGRTWWRLFQKLVVHNMITRFLFLYNNNDLLNLCYYHLFCRGFMFSVCYLYLFTYMLVSNTISKSILFLSFYSSTVPLVEQELLPIPKHLSSLPVLVRFALLNN